MEIINDINIIGRNKWNEFVGEHPQGTIFQTYEMFEIYKNTPHNRPIALAVVEDETVMGVLLAVLMWNGNPITKAFTARSIIIGGPIVVNENETILELLMQAYQKSLPFYTIYTEIRPIYCMDSVTDFLTHIGFKRKGHYNLILNLKPELEELLVAMHKKRRREIKKSIDFGLRFEELRTQEEKDYAVEILKQTYKRKRVPLSYSEMLPILSEYLGDAVKYFGAYLGNRMIASKIDLCFGNLVYAWFAGSDEKAFSYYPNDFLMWGLIGWSKNNGYEYLDFGGGGEPGVPYGVRDYKLKYGCQMFDYGRFQFFHRPLAYKIGEFVINKIIKR